MDRSGLLRGFVAVHKTPSGVLRLGRANGLGLWPENGGYSPAILAKFPAEQGRGTASSL